MTKYINSIKGTSSRILFQEFPEIKMKLWKGHLWSISYCILTTVKDSKLLLQTTLDVLKKYVESQGEENIERKEYNNCHMCGW